MNIVVIYKQDGTIQCDPTIKPRPLNQDEADLKKIGVGTIYGSGNVQGPGVHTTQCGAQTGRVNAFAISEDDWRRIQSGIVGTLGFELWIGAPLPDLGTKSGCVLADEPLPLESLQTMSGQPVLVRDLIGHPVRCYQRGDVLTKDYRPERVNVEHDENQRITRIWFG